MKLKYFFCCVFLQFQMICFGQGAPVGLVEDIPSAGALAAINKAYQLTDIVFSPVDSIRANPSKEYMAGNEYKGLIYSSVKEIDTFVGTDVSLHTYMTAIHNPRSVLYTENVGNAPYHGVNCGAYYGVVCNSFVSYALGFRVQKSTYDFSSSNDMVLVGDQSSAGIQLADVIWEKGHVMLVTRIFRDPISGRAGELEISEAKHSGCRRVLHSGEELDTKISNGQWRLYRYKYLDKNTYDPKTDFVAVDDEQLATFEYNDDICTNRGDRACFVQGDTVVLNIFNDYKSIEIYKDSLLYKRFRIKKAMDIPLVNLPYGDYKARLKKGRQRSEFTNWKVVDVHVYVDEPSKMVIFSSQNAIPVYLEFCNIEGVRPTKGVFELTANDLDNGFIDVSSFKMTKQQEENGMFVKVHFECDYGRVINKPIRWGVGVGK